MTAAKRGLFVGVVVVQRPEHRLGELAQVVRRDVGRHADRDTAGAVGQQVGEPAGQHGRLLHPAVVVRDEIDCLLVDFAQHLHRQRSQPRFGVPHAAGGSLPGEPKLPWPSTSG